MWFFSAIKMSRKKIDTNFKLKVVIEVFKESETRIEPAPKYDVSTVMDSRLEKSFIKSSAAASALTTEKDRYLR